jgi:hypothetical protein
MPYFGFNEALKKWGTGNKASIARDLQWKKEVDGDAQKIKQFQDVVGGLQDFRTYLLIKPGSAFVPVLHLPMKFVAISEATQHLHGRFVGFVEDCTATKDPTPIVLPQQKTWKWKTKMMPSDGMVLKAYYTADPTCRGRLWVSDQADSHEWMPVKAPLLLAIPFMLFKAIWEEGKLLMPHKIRGLVMGLIGEATDVAQASVTWDLIPSGAFWQHNRIQMGKVSLACQWIPSWKGKKNILANGLTNGWTQCLGPDQARGSPETWECGGALTHMMQRRCQH